MAFWFGPKEFKLRPFSSPSKLLIQGSYRSWKTWKVMEFKYFSFQAWKVMEFICWLWKGMENYSVCGTEIIAGVD